MPNEIKQKPYPDPRGMDPWEFQAQIAGYENGEEFKKEYFKTAGKAVGVGVVAGAGTFAAAFGLAAGTIAGAGEIPAIVGVAIRLGSRVLQVAKNVGVQAWNAAKSAYISLTGAAATPQGQEVVKNTVECVGNLIPGSPLPTTPKGSLCYTANEIIHRTKEKIENE